MKHHALATLARAAKKAKTFEIQKLVRKIKSAASATSTDASTQKGKPITASQLLELEGVLVALKSLQVDHLAAHALRTRLAKDKTGLGANEDVVLFCSQLQEASNSNAIDPTSAEGKAQNRVLASKAMADTLNDILANLRKKAGISTVAKSKQSSDNAAPAAGSTKDIKGKGKAVAVDPIPAKKSARQARHASEASTSDSDDGDETSSSEDDLGSDDGDESDATVSHISAEDAPPGADEEFGGFSDNNDNDDDDNISIASDSSFPVAAPKNSKKAKEADSLHAPSRKLDKIAKAALDRAPPPLTSAFLPSLAGGYTVGDPDGSVYSYSGDEGPAASKPERKNRRGQRARHA